MPQIYTDKHRLGLNRIIQIIHKIIIRHDNIIFKAGIIGIAGRLMLKICMTRELNGEISSGIIADGKIDKITADKEGVNVFKMIKPNIPKEYIKIETVIIDEKK